jgi:hypothetical protein
MFPVYYATVELLRPMPSYVSSSDAYYKDNSSISSSLFSNVYPVLPVILRLV